MSIITLLHSCEWLETETRPATKFIPTTRTTTVSWSLAISNGFEFEIEVRSHRNDGGSIVGF